MKYFIFLISLITAVSLGASLFLAAAMVIIEAGRHPID